MGKSLKEIAQELKKSEKKVQLIYAFNSIGKTRLSREFKELDSLKQDEEESLDKVLYYNAFTEDLFYWDNDLEGDTNRKLKIRPNGFTPWVLEEQGQNTNIVTCFQYYTSDKLTPHFNQEYTTKNKEGETITVPANSEITFSIEGGNEEKIENIKISRGEESCFIWCVFYSLIKEVIGVLNSESDDRSTKQFDKLKYIFIHDPVSSLDENHLIEMAVNIADLIKSSPSELKFIITTHNPLFYNVLFNEFNCSNPATGYKPRLSIKERLEKLNDGTFSLIEQSNDSPFSYHLYLLSEIDKALQSGDIHKYHFNFLRNILEKTSTFLGYTKWKDLLPEDSREAYYNRIINLSSHGKFSSEEVSVIEDNDKRVLSYLVDQIKTKCSFMIVKNK